MYQSYKVLSEPHPDVRPHDFMDDLKSFFYVWCHVTFLYNGGRPMQPAANHLELKTWNSTRELAARSKCSFLYSDQLPRDAALNGLDINTRVLVFELINSF